MLKSYFTIALRNILRSKAYSFINIAGLSLGVACCLLLALYIQDEMSYDKHHERLDDIYRLTTIFESKNGFGEQGTVSPPIAMTLKEEIPEIEAAVRLLSPIGVSQSLIRYGDKLFYEKDGLIADSTLFEVFTYEFLEGNPQKALVEANTVVVSDKLAAKLFGNDRALDKTITISQGGDPVDFKITGVIKDNTKTHAYGNFITSMASDGWAAYLRSDNALNEWGGQNFVPSYIKLVPGHNAEEVKRKINQVLIKYGAEDMKAMGMSKTLGMELVKDIYLKSSVGNKSSRIIYIYVIASIALFILLIACINFMNLSTARATKRANEIGVRKVMGAFRSSLIGQLMGEAMLIVSLSILLSVVMMQLALPLFNALTGKAISFGSQNAVYFIIALVVITLVTGLVAGSYPAFYLSSFQPAQVLKGKVNMGNASGWLRRSLVVFQFMIAIALVCSMIVVSQQLSFMQEQDLGFDAKAKIILPLRTGSAKKNYTVLKTELAKSPSVKQVSGTDYMMGAPIFSDMSFYKDGETMDQAINNSRNTVDFGYMELLDIKLLAGRNFTDNPLMERNKLILNKTSASKFGMEPEQMVGQKLHFEWQGTKYDFEVIGVMDDYHQLSLKQQIRPTMFEMPDSLREFDYLIASVDTKDFAGTISSMEKIWKSLINDTPFEYSFLDADIQKQYEEDQKVGNIITSFTFIAMFISCLGLYGLSTYMAERRFKEIGIRKVMGASVNQIVQLMSMEFIRLVLIAFIIAVPLAWYGMDKWLQGFAYHIPMNIMIFVYAGIAALLIALLTVSVESLRAASSDPVKALRNE